MITLISPPVLGEVRVAQIVCWTCYFSNHNVGNWFSTCKFVCSFCIFSLSFAQTWSLRNSPNKMGCNILKTSDIQILICVRQTMYCLVYRLWSPGLTLHGDSKVIDLLVREWYGFVYGVLLSGIFCFQNHYT